MTLLLNTISQMFFVFFLHPNTTFRKRKMIFFFLKIFVSVSLTAEIIFTYYKTDFSEKGSAALLM